MVHILPSLHNNALILFSAASTAYLESTIYTQTTAANVEPTITVSIVEQQFNTFEQPQDGVQPIATESATPLTLTHLSLPLVIGMNFQ